MPRAPGWAATDYRRAIAWFISSSCALVALTLLPIASSAAQLDLVVSGLSSPLYVTHSRDGTGRLFIVEQDGVIKVLKPGTAAPTVFLDISGRVLSGGERGLLGLAFHPQFTTNRRFFVNYTRRPDGATQIVEYRASIANPDLADPLSERLLLEVAQPFANHNGGMVEFGPDGFLYIGLGDGGSANDPQTELRTPTTSSARSYGST
jgi:glucose/arabinose dehydrogenase